MKQFLHCLFISSIVCSIFISEQACSQSGDDELVGMWEGRRIAGPEIQGDLLIGRDVQQWWADVSGFRVAVTVQSNALSFEIPGGRGSFSGSIDSEHNQIKGHWTQPGIINNGMPHASPVVLNADGENRWRGQIVPLYDEFSLFLPVTKRDDGSFGTFMRNPDRGFGVFYNLDRLELRGDRLQWIGRFFRNTDETVLVEADYQPGRMAVNIRGNLYDMRLSNDDSHSHFYARGKHPEPYSYSPPPSNDDGWNVSTLNDARIDANAIGKFINEVILPPADSIDDPYIHGFLVARSGKLVLEEYFHGFHRNKPHDTRSASKSLAAVLAGAAMQAGMPVAEASPVYKTISAEVSGDEHDPRRDRMTLAHLLSMSSGLDCDDSDSSSRGNEDVMQSQEEQPDWYQYTLDLDMVREPGAMAVYCSAGMNLVGAVLEAATGSDLEALFQELIAEPLQMEHYYLNLSPTGQPYMGGGIYWLPRDFMKLGQLMMNGGTWNDRRILSQAYSEKSISAIYEMNDKGYGYGWWSIQYPYKDSHVTAFFAAGNGGQLVMGIPELDLLIAFFAGNYSHRTLFRIQEEFVPEYILPALR